MLIDEVEITLKAGHGGAGKVSFGKGAKSGPDGGSGGRGGDLYAKAVSDIYALSEFSRVKVKVAEDGGPGRLAQQDGKDGEDLTVGLPAGTTLIDQETQEEIELKEVGQTVLVCRGGIGGLGNHALRSARNTTPLKAQGGRPGNERHFKAVLKLIADSGLIGLPNTGKSSLLNELTQAKAQTADYAFTTLEPNLGVLQKDKYDKNKKVIADIPGLIEGASHGRGLGVKVLKHIEKVELLFHCVAADSEDVARDYLTVRKELEAYSKEMTKKEEIILLTKVDMVSTNELKEKIRKLKKFKRKVLAVSIHDWESIEELKTLLTRG